MDAGGVVEEKLPDTCGSGRSRGQRSEGAGTELSSPVDDRRREESVSVSGIEEVAASHRSPLSSEYIASTAAVATSECHSPAIVPSIHLLYSIASTFRPVL